MTINLMKAEVVAQGGTPILGYSWPPAAFPFEELLASVYPANLTVWAQPARIPVAGNTVASLDACDFSRQFAQGTPTTVTVQRNGGTLSGLPRWQTENAAGPNNGLYASKDLAAPLTSYTYAALVKFAATGTHQAIITVGGSSDRSMLYLQISRAIGFQHTASDIKSGTTLYSAGVWLPVIASYNAVDQSVRVYVNSTTPEISAVMTVAPPVTKNITLGVTSDFAYEMTGDIALACIWDRALHLDSIAIGNAMAALQGMAAL